jgi:hypothetical protein
VRRGSDTKTTAGQVSAQPQIMPETGGGYAKATTYVGKDGPRGLQRGGHGDRPSRESMACCGSEIDGSRLLWS